MGNVDLNMEQWIDQYLRNELEEEQVTLFEERMHKDAEFLEEVLLRKDIVIGIRAAEHQSVRDRLEKIREAVENNKELPALDKNGKNKKVIKIVSAIIGFIIGYLVYEYLIKG